jgi:hypothetical protein
MSTYWHNLSNEFMYMISYILIIYVIVQWALVSAVMNLQAPPNAGKPPSGRTICGLPSGTQPNRASQLVTKI